MSRRPSGTEPPVLVPSVPRWPRWACPEDQREQDGCATAVQVGAALAALDAAVAPAPPYAGAWASRLALAAAAGAVARDGRLEDEAALRDLVAFSPELPAGPVTAVVRAHLWLVAGAPGHRWSAVPELIAGFRVRDDALPDALAGRLAAAAAAVCPLAATAAAVQAVLTVRPGRGALALWAADVTLSRWLGWDHGLPLVTLGFRQRGGALDALASADDPRLAGCVLHGATRAFDGFVLLGYRSSGLQALRARLRARAAGAVIDRLLARDALSVAGVRDLIPERAARRLFDRLTDLGGVRELTGRSTARLYGL
nr:DUF1403 family protein [Azospirillum sp. OGB3]